MVPKDRTSGESVLESVPTIAEDRADEITAGETERLVQSAAEIIAVQDWDRSPKILAFSLAMRIFVGEHMPEIGQLGQAILKRAMRKP